MPDSEECFYIDTSTCGLILAVPHELTQHELSSLRSQLVDWLICWLVEWLKDFATRLKS